MARSWGKNPRLAPRSGVYPAGGARSRREGSGELGVAGAPGVGSAAGGHWGTVGSGPEAGAARSGEAARGEHGGVVGDLLRCQGALAGIALVVGLGITPALLVICRLIQGFAVAGEISGSCSMILEHAPFGRRGFFASFSLQGVQFGQILAAAIFLHCS